MSLKSTSTLQESLEESFTEQFLQIDAIMIAWYNELSGTHLQVCHGYFDTVRPSFTQKASDLAECFTHVDEGGKLRKAGRGSGKINGVTNNSGSGSGDDSNGGLSESVSVRPDSSVVRPNRFNPEARSFQQTPDPYFHFSQ